MITILSGNKYKYCEGHFSAESSLDRYHCFVLSVHRLYTQWSQHHPNWEAGRIKRIQTSLRILLMQSWVAHPIRICKNSNLEITIND